MGRICQIVMAGDPPRALRGAILEILSKVAELLKLRSCIINQFSSSFSPFHIFGVDILLFLFASPLKLFMRVSSCTLKSGIGALAAPVLKMPCSRAKQV
jgi:hypothetical protein